MSVVIDQKTKVYHNDYFRLELQPNGSYRYSSNNADPLPMIAVLANHHKHYQAGRGAWYQPAQEK